LRWSVIFRGKTCGVTNRAPLSSKIFFSTQVPPSKHLSSTLFSPFPIFKNTPPCRHLLLPSVSSSLPPTLSPGPLAPCTYHLSYSRGILHKESSHFLCYSTTRAKEAVSRKYKPVTAGSVLRSCLRGKTPSMSLL
jgi:hypothetical protein